MKNKKGDLTSKTIITWVILIVTFGIILLFITVFPWGEEKSRDSCHTTIVMRASANLDKLNGLKGDIPLKCQTQKICLKSGLFGSCPNLGKTSTINMPGADKADVVNSIAETLYADYIMTGKGLLNFMPRGFTNQKYCLITSKLSLDPKTQVSITPRDIYQRLSQIKNDNDVSYLKEMYGLESPDQMQEYFSQVSKVKGFEGATSFMTSPLDFSKNDYDIVVAVTQNGWWKSVAGGVGVAVSVALIPWTLGASAWIGTGIVAGAATTYTFGQNNEDYQYNLPILVVNTPEALKQLDCSSIETLA